MTQSTHARESRSLPDELSWRVIGLLNLFRLLAPMVLILLFFFNAPNRSVGTAYPGLFLGICVAYFTFGLVSIHPIQRQWPSAQWMALFPLAIDAIAITLLVHASGGVSSGLATLLFLPIGATAAIVHSRLALFATALVAIGLLVETTVSTLSGVSLGADFLVAGLTGASLFAVTLLAIPLANRLRESEALVQQRDIDLANLNELNKFIVQHLRDSIVVVDETDHIRLINDTAARLLAGGAVTSGALLIDVAPRLQYLLDNWRKRQHDRRDWAREVVSGDGGTVIRPHFVALSDRGPGSVLIFLEDTSVVAERVQQSKLASLGRLSASIAHEIRNPVGAMSHAGQLLKESPALGPDDRHLTDIIEKNAVRVSQIIENVLQLSRRDTTRQERINLAEWLGTFLAEFRETLQIAPERVLAESPVPELEVTFDPSQLHQVVWNLCDNALKHGGDDEQWPVILRVGRIASTGRPYLEINDRGPGIDPAQAERIFEPFFSNGTGGTGLGLFISRELCQTNGALLAYEARAGGGSIFRIIFADPQRWEA
jgi:two-component system sensor histidine kinase PilS (NtrC family)